MTADLQANLSPQHIRFFIVRHGQTDQNKEKILQGQNDTLLNETGIHQAQLVGNYLKRINFDKLISSDLTRCVATMKEIAVHQPHITDIRYTPSLRERNMGKVQGMKLQEARDTYGAHYRSFGETGPELVARVGHEWDVLVENCGKDANYLLCTHGGVIRGLIGHLHRERGYGLVLLLTEDDLKVPFNTSVSVIDVEKKTGEGTIQSFGFTGHLGGHFEVQDQALR